MPEARFVHVDGDDQNGTSRNAWPDDEAMDELIRWEILRRQSNDYLRFYRDRVEVVDRTYNILGNLAL